MYYICIMYLVLIIKHLCLYDTSVEAFNNRNMTWEAEHYSHLTGVLANQLHFVL